MDESIWDSPPTDIDGEPIPQEMSPDIVMDLDEVLLSESLDNQVVAEKIDADYDAYMQILVDKHQLSNKNKLCGDIIMMDSFDGAEHSNNPRTCRNIVSYNSQLLSAGTINDGNSPAQSFNILTWQQVLGDEKCANIFPVVDSVYESKKKLINEGLESLPSCNVSFYDMHDGKMLYLLTQHSLYSRKFHPFLLCDCK